MAVPKENPDVVLRDLGERRIVEELISPRFPTPASFLVGIGDDCAIMRFLPDGEAVVVTIDPCPTPVQCIVAPNDYYYYGWLTVLINVSDLAAKGARPLGIVVSTVMPEDMRISDYERFLDGVAEAAREWNCPVVGGNIKDGSGFTATGTGLGAIRPERLMRRCGTRPGDKICVIGEMGAFWVGVLSRLFPEVSLEESARVIGDRALFHPVARVREAQLISETGVVTACMDSSDGIINCLHEFARLNDICVTVDSIALTPPPGLVEVAAAAGVDFRKLMLAWGGWELVFTVANEHVQQVQILLQGADAPFRVIGEITGASPAVFLRESNGRQQALSNFGSARFASSSYFSHGLSSYIDLLKEDPR
jgi:thiamine-monophosphate kinase